jgi:DNA-binding MarR family transcriptional regulator
VDEALADHGLRWLDYALLLVARQVVGLTQQGLGERTLADRTRVSDALYELEERELVRRDAGLDRRRRLVYLTESGRDLLEEMMELVEQAERAALLPLDPRERARLGALLAQVIPPERGLFDF